MIFRRTLEWVEAPLIVILNHAPDPSLKFFIMKGAPGQRFSHMLHKGLFIQVAEFIQALITDHLIRQDGICAHSREMPLA